MMRITRLVLVFFASFTWHGVTAASIGFDHTGSWYNSDQSGHGFSIEYGYRTDDSPFVVVYWYLYDDKGNPIFIVGTNTPDGDTVEINFKAPHGMIYGDFDPTSVVRENGGSGTFIFSDENKGQFNYQPSQYMEDTYGATPVTLSIVKLAGVAHPEYADEITALQAQVSELQALLSGIVRGIDADTGQDTLVFSDMNVQIVNGTGTTNGDVNGTGNLIIGYNEPRDEASAKNPCPSEVLSEWYCNRRTGSHNLVVGSQNNYTAFGGVTIGLGSETAGDWASVSGGRFNDAVGTYSSISGGWRNIASGNSSSVSGGGFNLASGLYSSVSGGWDNVADAEDASVSSGHQNIASGIGSSVTGGRNNVASGAKSTVAGGETKTAASENCVVGDDGIDC